MGEDVWVRRAAILLCAVIGVGAIWALLHYAAAPCAAVLVAWAVAAAVNPAARWTSRKTGIPRKVCAGFYVLLLFGLAVLLLCLFAMRLWEEMERLFGWLTENRVRLTLAMDRLVAAWERILAHVPILGEALRAEDASGVLAGWLDGILASLGSALAAGIGSAARRLPRGIFLLVVSVMACLYLSMDYETLNRGLLRRLPAGVSERVRKLGDRGKRAIRGYARAYLLLMGLTFCQVFLGLLIIGQPYAFLIALGVAVVDLLPVLGAGAILLPWGIVLLATGDSSAGVGLLILYGVITIVRQIAEPRLIGGSLGLPPFVSLISMLFGFWLFGFFGMLLAPAAALLLKECLLPAEEKKSRGI